MAKKKRKSGIQTTNASLRKYLEEPLLALEAPRPPLPSLRAGSVSATRYCPSLAKSSPDLSPTTTPAHDCVVAEDCSEDEEYIEEEVVYSETDEELGSRPQFCRSRNTVHGAGKFLATSNFVDSCAYGTGGDLICDDSLAGEANLGVFNSGSVEDKVGQSLPIVHASASSQLEVAGVQHQRTTLGPSNSGVKASFNRGKRPANPTQYVVEAYKVNVSLLDSAPFVCRNASRCDSNAAAIGASSQLDQELLMAGNHPLHDSQGHKEANSAQYVAEACDATASRLDSAPLACRNPSRRESNALALGASFQLDQELLMAGISPLHDSQGHENDNVRPILDSAVRSKFASSAQSGREQLPLDTGARPAIPLENMANLGINVSDFQAHVTRDSRVPNVAPHGTRPASPGKPNAPVSTQWRDLFANNHSAECCTKLIHYEVITETGTCTLLNGDCNFEIWKDCLVGYVAGKSPGFKALNGMIADVWKCQATLTIHDSGWLVYRFSSEEDKLAVLNGGPYLIYGRPLLLKLMPDFFDFSEKAMSAVPVWVKFPNLPLECWSTVCLSKIASMLGKPIQCDKLTASMDRLSYARVLVEVNIMWDLPRSVRIQLPNGTSLLQMVIYETLPIHCKHCKVLGHNTASCKKNLEATTQKGGKTSVFNRLGLLSDSATPNAGPMFSEVAAAFDGWEVVRSKQRNQKSTNRKGVLISGRSVATKTGGAETGAADTGVAETEAVETGAAETDAAITGAAETDSAAAVTDAVGVDNFMLCVESEMNGSFECQGRLGSSFAGAASLGGEEQCNAADRVINRDRTGCSTGGSGPCTVTSESDSGGFRDSVGVRNHGMGAGSKIRGGRKGKTAGGSRLGIDLSETRNKGSREAVLNDKGYQGVVTRSGGRNFSSGGLRDASAFFA